MTRNTLAGLAIAAAAATLFVAGTGASLAAEAGGAVVKAKCFGTNACKGQSDCKTTANACKGLNACKGEGFELHPLGSCQPPGRA